MGTTTTALLILGIIAVSLLIIALLYIIAASRRRAIVMKKVDYLVEDVTYKSEMLNSTVETVSKVSNYVEAFEVVARKNMKSAAKLASRNKDDIYKIINRLKKIAIGNEQESQINKGNSTRKKTSSNVKNNKKNVASTNTMKIKTTSSKKGNIGTTRTTRVKKGGK